jgi:membrane fusion protein
MATPQPTPLFRAEVMQAQQTQWLGSIRIGRNPSFALVAWVSLLLGASSIAFAAWGQVARKARVPGLIVPTLGTLQLSAVAPGVLAERRVAEGDSVQAGQVLFVLATDRATSDGATSVLVSASLQQRRVSLQTERGAREQQARQRRQALADRIRALDTERQQAENEAEFAERRVALARKSADRYQQLVKEGFVSDVQAQAKQEELIDAQSRAEAAKRNAGVLAREQQGLRAELDAIAAQWATDTAQLDRAAAALEQEVTENESRKSIAVTAPQAGTVTALHLPLGATVQAGQTLATLVPSPQCVPRSASVRAEPSSPVRAEPVGAQPPCAASPLEAHLYAPSRTAGFIQPGQSVWLRYAAYPYQKFGMAQGRVVSVGRTPVNPQDLPAGQANALLQAAQSQEPLYRIGVALAAQSIDVYGRPQPLRPGMTLEADVVQERRAVWEWLLEPVLATAARVKVLSASPAKAGPGG